MRVRFSVLLSILIFSACIVSCNPGVPVEILVNGGFETGTSSGWSTNILYDNLILVTNSSSNAGFFTSGPADGNYHAIFEQNSGPGSSSLIQTFIMPDSYVSAVLSFQMYDYSIDPIWITNSITNEDGQFLTVDILTESANAWTMNNSDIVANIYLGGSTNTNISYHSYTIDLTDHLEPGQTYKIRFGSCVYSAPILVGIDDVSLMVQ